MATAAPPVPLDTLLCRNCPRWVSSPGALCAPCVAGEPVPSGRTPPTARRRPALWPLLVFPALLAVGLAGKGVFEHTAPLLLLFGAMGACVFFLRRAVAELFRRVTWTPPFRPWWAVQRVFPRPLRWIAAIGAPLVLGFVLTPLLSDVFSGYGFPITAISVSVSSMIAFLFLAEGPRR